MAIKNFVTPISLDHAQIAALDFLVRGEAVRAAETNASTPDTGVIARLPRIDDLVIAVSALWTAHGVVGGNPLHYTL